jgi:hypothetical protein
MQQKAEQQKDEQQKDEQQKDEQICRNCRTSKLSNGKPMCDDCFSQHHLCKTCVCLTEPFHVYCDDCYKKTHQPRQRQFNGPAGPRSHGQGPRQFQQLKPYQSNHQEQSYKCRDCTNPVSRIGSLCDHCFNGSHRCLGRMPDGDECEDYAERGRMLCFECQKRKSPDRFAKRRF